MAKNFEKKSVTLFEDEEFEILNPNADEDDEYSIAIDLSLPHWLIVNVSIKSNLEEEQQSLSEEENVFQNSEPDDREIESEAEHEIEEETSVFLGQEDSEDYPDRLVPWYVSYEVLNQRMEKSAMKRLSKFYGRNNKSRRSGFLGKIGSGPKKRNFFTSRGDF